MSPPHCHESLLKFLTDVFEAIAFTHQNEGTVFARFNCIFITSVAKLDAKNQSLCTSVQSIRSRCLQLRVTFLMQPCQQVHTLLLERSQVAWLFWTVGTH